MPVSPALLDAAIDRAIARNRVTGAVVLVAEDGVLAYRRAAGWADREAQRPMADDAIFRLASIAKLFTAVAAQALAEAGALDPAAPVTRYLPDFRPRLPDGSEPAITIRQLQTHTAGLTYRFLQLPDGPYARADISDGLDLPGRGMDDNLRRIAAQTLSFAPGTRWGYSVASDVLGAAMAAAAGQPLPDIVTERVTAPLDLFDTGFRIADPGRLAVPYADAATVPVRMDDDFTLPIQGRPMRFAPSRLADPASFPSGGAGMAGTAGDVLALLEALRQGGAPLLSERSTAALTANATGSFSIPLQGPGWGFGLGVSVLVDPAAAATPQAAGTFAWGGVYGHSWFVDPASRLSVVALTDTAIAGMSGGAFAHAIRNACYGLAPPG